jgi:hypothetical protein
MGYGFSVECSSCGFTKHFNIGIGFYDSCLEHIVENLHGFLKREVKEIMDNHCVRSYKFDRLLARCTQCNTLSAMEYVKISYDKGKVFESSLTCSKCKKPL